MPDIYQRIIDTLTACRRVLITTHVRPDGDALGTTAAMAMGLRARGIEPHVLLLSHLPTKYAFIYRDYNIPFTDVESGWPAEFSIDAFDAVLVMDTGTWSQLPGLKERLEKYTKPKIVVDHHLTQENWADLKLVVTEAAAAGEICAELLEAWDIKFDKPMATALFLAITTDTGPYTMRLAALLMEAGVDTDRMYQLLYQNERAERVALQTRALQSLELLEGGRLAVMRVRKRDFIETNAGVPDTENLINLPLQIRTVEVSILITEPIDFGPVRISLRSKGQVDVAKFAEQFGGGGHARAAGLKLEAAFDDAHDKVVDAMKRLMQT
jgi:phosphoesterase RecJ-like protein